MVDIAGIYCTKQVIDYLTIISNLFFLKSSCCRTMQNCALYPYGLMLVTPSWVGRLMLVAYTICVRHYMYIPNRPYFCELCKGGTYASPTRRFNMQWVACLSTVSHVSALESCLQPLEVSHTFWHGGACLKVTCLV